MGGAGSDAVVKPQDRESIHAGDLGDLSVSSVDLRSLTGFKLGEAYVRARRLFKIRMTALGLTPLEYSVLSLLGAQSVHQAKLSTTLNIPAQNMTVILTRMAQRGLLTRTQSASDRRAQTICLSDAGRAQLHEADNVMRFVEQDLLAPLTPGERMIFGEILDKVARVGSVTAIDSVAGSGDDVAQSAP
jgi:DNA-binding MarR family transcriptional regulator